MKRLLYGFVFLACMGLAFAQQGVVVGPNPPCSAFGTTSGTCLQGAGALGTPSSGTATNLTGTAAGLTAGAATTTNQINGVDQTASWSTYTPTVTCAVGSITTDTVSGRYRAIGKTVAIQIVLTITTLGTCTGNVSLTTPPSLGVNTTGVLYPLAGFNASTGAAIVAYGSSPTSVVMGFAVGPAGSTLYVVNGTYETP